MDFQKNELEHLYEKSFQSIEEGAVIKGRIVSKMPDSIVLDIGYKSEGFVPIEEFSREEREALQPGDELEVYVSQLRDQDGFVSLSREKALKIKVLQKLQNASKEGAPVTGKIVERVKGGFYADIMGIKAFLPGSQADIKPVKDPNQFIGKEFSFKILKLNTKLTNIIVSRRAILEEERGKLRTETLDHLKEGAVLKGYVKNITDYGVFVDLGGIDGLLHISDISWGRISHPSEVFSMGDAVEVMVLQYDPQTDKVTLGYKQKRPDPWQSIESKYPVGSKVAGKIVSITDYGIFVEVEEGVEGLVHISELDWNPRPRHPSKYVSLGDTAEAVVLKVESAERRLSLSIRQLKPKPWDLVAQRYSVGQKITGKIRTITEFGAFVGLPEGVDALIHISDISWRRHIKHPSDVLKKGQKVEAVILHIEPEKEKMALGIKQLTEDPWKKDIPERYHIGNEVTCRILRITDFGIFVEINEEVEGLVYSSEIEGKGEEYKEGDVVRARIIKMEPDERKIGLSMKNLARTASTDEEQRHT
jgi:small subunit ribosomal protein S1